jgi:hypothetical protein
MGEITGSLSKSEAAKIVSMMLKTTLEIITEDEPTRPPVGFDPISFKQEIVGEMTTMFEKFAAQVQSRPPPPPPPSFATVVTGRKPTGSSHSMSSSSQQPSQKPHTPSREVHELTVVSGEEGTMNENEFTKHKKQLGQVLSAGGAKPLVIRQSRAGNFVVGFETLEAKRKGKGVLKLENKVVRDSEDRLVPLAIRGLPKGNADEISDDFAEANPTFRKHKDLIKLELIEGKTGKKALKLLTTRTIAVELLDEGRLFSSSELTSHRVAAWRISPKLCQKCARLGHLEPACKEMMRCGRCSANNHPTAQCKEEKKCQLCSENNSPHDHESRSKECTVWQEETTRINDELHSFIYQSSKN